MQKILFLPLLDSLESGHHHVANSLCKYIEDRSYDTNCKTIDIIHNWNPRLEQFITNSYLMWIKGLPKTYDYVYKHLLNNDNANDSLSLLDSIFLKEIKKIIVEQNPRLVICTHSFSSYLVDKLKKSTGYDFPVVNVYTDFFINDLWGLKNIDYHFVADANMKLYLAKEKGIDPQRIIVSGIPIDECFYFTGNGKGDNSDMNIIVSGGSAGLGNIDEIIETSRVYQGIRLHVLCGHNENLYSELKLHADQKIKPLPFISSKKDMNDLYGNADAIVSKPGGVTVSEALHKGVPIFIASVLPGQEEINFEILKSRGLVFPIDEKMNPVGQVMKILKDNARMIEYEKTLADYKSELEISGPSDIFRLIEKLI